MTTGELHDEIQQMDIYNHDAITDILLLIVDKLSELERKINSIQPAASLAVEESEKQSGR